MAVSSDYFSLVCAIDFGTTFAGYAYSPKLRYKYDPLNISVSNWEAPTSIKISYKTQQFHTTTILLNKHKGFVAFGYEAENTYAELAEGEEDEDYFYIRRFKILLYDTLKKQRLTRETMIKDITGKKEVKAIEVLKHAIKFFRDMILNTIDKKGLGVKNTNIRWVLTVPAIWSDPAKQFMTEAAIQAYLEQNSHWHSEVASIYCSRLPFSKFVDGNGFGFYKIGQKFMVLDAERTVDITVHELTDNKTLKVLKKSTCLGLWRLLCRQLFQRHTNGCCVASGNGSLSYESCRGLQ